MNNSENNFKLGIIIPTYNHFNALQKVLYDLINFNCPLIIVDDASTDGLGPNAESLQANYANLIYIQHPYNQGKGAAVKTGFNAAKNLGLTHILTLDADGQHRLSGVEKLIAAAKIDTDTCIFGKPIFTKNAPIVRRLGREISNILCWLFTCSFKVRDVLCGARIYPIKLSEDAILKKTKSLRMEFDPEVAIRIVQSKVPVINIAINVDYPSDGLSHFRYIKDNILIAKMNLGIFCEALFFKNKSNKNSTHV